MKLSTLKVSNVLSYGLLTNFDSAPDTIQFKDDLNIFIGSNGSGKSNLIEIINKIFQSHFLRSYFIADAYLYSTSDSTMLVQLNHDRQKNIPNTLNKHSDHPNSPSLVQVGIALDQGDIDNFLFIHSNREELLTLSRKYCGDRVLIECFNSALTKSDLESITKVLFTFEIKSQTNTSTIDFTLLNTSLEPLHTLVYNYLVYFNQLQSLLEAANMITGKTWSVLRNPFALISSMRQYGGLSSSVSVGTGLNEQVKSANQSEGQQSTKAYVGTDYIYRMTSLRLGQLFRKLRDKSGADDALLNITSSDNTLTKIAKSISTHLGFTVRLENYNAGNDTVSLHIHNGDELMRYDELSMGQRSIFYLLFAAYGYDIENGVLIVDEPELHLHPTMQKTYFSILKEISAHGNIQVLIATHSSVFIDEATIKNTFRFYKKDGITSIVCPRSVDASDKDLLKILTYTNSARIFFSDIVVLVEGESDEYFYSYFYDRRIRGRNLTLKSTEILSIGGKGNFHKWRDFLGLFEIKSFFIGDFDNVKEFNILRSAGVDYDKLLSGSMDDVIARISKKVIARPSNDGSELLRQLHAIVESDFDLTPLDKENLSSLWMYIVRKQGLRGSAILGALVEQGQEQKLDTIAAEIIALYEQGIFILKQGDLEEYLSIPKDMTKVIEFCQGDFDAWMNSEEIKGTSSKVLELDDIFDRILHSP